MPANESDQPIKPTDGHGEVAVTHDTDEIASIFLQGEFDLATSSQIIQKAEQLLEENNHLIIDLSDATFVDSSIINVILRAYKASTEKGRVTVLQLGTAAVVERVVDISGITRIIPRAKDRAEAIRMIQEVAGGEA
jgi:stage II sporulation protein AA (anti-sigma F factor antagonist)